MTENNVERSLTEKEIKEIDILNKMYTEKRLHLADIVLKITILEQQFNELQKNKVEVQNEIYRSYGVLGDRVKSIAKDHNIDIENESWSIDLSRMVLIKKK